MTTTSSSNSSSVAKVLPGHDVEDDWTYSLAATYVGAVEREELPFAFAPPIDAACISTEHDLSSSNNLPTLSPPLPKNPLDAARTSTTGTLSKTIYPQDTERRGQEHGKGQQQNMRPEYSPRALPPAMAEEPMCGFMHLTGPYEVYADYYGAKTVPAAAAAPVAGENAQDAGGSALAMQQVCSDGCGNAPDGDIKRSVGYSATKNFGGGGVGADADAVDGSTYSFVAAERSSMLPFWLKKSKQEEQPRKHDEMPKVEVSPSLFSGGVGAGGSGGDVLTFLLSGNVRGEIGKVNMKNNAEADVEKESPSRFLLGCEVASSCAQSARAALSNGNVIDALRLHTRAAKGYMDASVAVRNVDRALASSLVALGHAEARRGESLRKIKARNDVQEKNGGTKNEKGKDLNVGSNDAIGAREAREPVPAAATTTDADAKKMDGKSSGSGWKNAGADAIDGRVPTEALSCPKLTPPPLSSSSPSSTSTADRIRQRVRGVLHGADAMREDDISASAFLGEELSCEQRRKQQKGQHSHAQAEEQARGVSKTPEKQRADDDADHKNYNGSEQCGGSNPIDDMMKLERELNRMDMALSLGNSVASLAASSSSVSVASSSTTSSFYSSFTSPSLSVALLPHGRRGRAQTPALGSMTKARKLGKVDGNGSAAAGAVQGSFCVIANKATEQRSPHAQHQKQPQPELPFQNDSPPTSRTVTTTTSVAASEGLESSWWGGASVGSSVLSSPISHAQFSAPANINVVPPASIVFGGSKSQRAPQHPRSMAAAVKSPSSTQDSIVQQQLKLPKTASAGNQQQQQYKDNLASSISSWATAMDGGTVIATRNICGGVGEALVEADTNAKASPSSSARTEQQANPRQLLQLLDALKTLGDENAALLREVEDARAARFEARAARDEMSKFKEEYNTRFDQLRAALERFRLEQQRQQKQQGNEQSHQSHQGPDGGQASASSNPVLGSEYFVRRRHEEEMERVRKLEQSVRRLTSDLRKERDEGRKKDVALRKYENFYREVKARSAQRSAQRAAAEKKATVGRAVSAAAASHGSTAQGGTKSEGRSGSSLSSSSSSSLSSLQQKQHLPPPQKQQQQRNRQKIQVTHQQKQQYELRKEQTGVQMQQHQLRFSPKRKSGMQHEHHSG